jgi:MFS family permease
MNNPLITLLRVFIPFGAGYFLSYLYRAVNAVIASDLTGDLSLAPATLGMLTAVYFISFAAFQLPLGILLDRFGPRKVEAVLLLFAAFGALVFSKAETITGLVIGRALIGFGVSACLMAAFKAYTLWFPKEKWPMINGFQMAAGGLGALAATAPVEAALHFTDWRGVFLLLSVFTFFVSLMVLFVVPEKKVPTTGESLGAQIQSISKIFRDRRFLAIAPLTTSSQAAFMAIQGLRAGPWLTEVAQLERSEAASVLFWIAVSMVFGFIVLGSLSAKLAHKGFSVTHTAVLGMCSFMVIQLLLALLPLHLLKACIYPLWMLFGFTGTSGIIAYAALSQSFSAHLSGRVTTAINLLVFIAAFCAQWLIGGIIQFFSPPSAAHLSSTGFTAAFLVMLAFEVLGLICFLVLRKNKIDEK